MAAIQPRPFQIAFVADNQIDEGSRLEEHDRVMDWIAEDVARRSVDLVIHGGDLFERRSTANERTRIYGWVEKVANSCPVIICGGNHEAPGEVEEVERLTNGRTNYPVIARETPDVIAIGRVGIGVVPWIRRGHLLAALAKRGIPVGDVDEQMTGPVQNLLRGLFAASGSADAPDFDFRVLVTHATIKGCRTDPDQPLRSSEFEVGLDDLMLAKPDVVLAGHIHLPQHWDHAAPSGTVPVIYAGSPRRTAYAPGEVVEKGYVLVRLNGVREGGFGYDPAMASVTWERIPTPATPMVLLEDEWVPDEKMPGWQTGLNVTIPKGAEVRFRYVVEEQHRTAAAGAAESVRKYLLEVGAAEVVVDEVVKPDVRARCAEIAEETTLDGKLRRYWGIRGVTFTPEREARLFSLLGRLDSEVTSEA